MKVARLRIIAIVCTILITVVSVVAYVWLVPDPARKPRVGIQLTPSSTPKTDVIPTKEATAQSQTPTPLATTVTGPSTNPTTAPSQPTQPPSQPYTGPCTGRSPYGFTTTNADSSLVDIYKQMNVCWVRLQIHESDLHQDDGTYNWAELDGIVATMNAAGIHLDVPLECFDGPSGTGSNSCFTNPYFPTVQEVADFATQIATRYNGNNGYGFIDAYEIFNEEPEVPNVSFDITNYCPLLSAGYKAIKGASPTAKVGMYGTYLSNPNVTSKVLNAIFQGGCGNSMDFMNFHYYNQGMDPTTDADSLHPSFDHKWQMMRNIAANYGFGSKPIWVTEIGWPTSALSGRQPVTPEVQAQYLEYVSLHAASSGGAVQRMFWFTVNMGNQPNTIYPPNGPLPAFNTLINVVKYHPFW